MGEGGGHGEHEEGLRETPTTTASGKKWESVKPLPPTLCPGKVTYEKEADSWQSPVDVLKPRLLSRRTV
ncbi:hypothetical protein PFLUV_G00040970 [Perca fluviatilis]|uniref:Uncharacterized protein n=1 Tax=Perca fluviatilis TaxID=8168 RepID=A0A6A5EPM9_PERFL|nr:hypothetical protein PFLUV_G00040970 [Perca fluviatilis]